MARTHYRACNLCEAICGLAITVEGDQITDIRGDPRDPLSRGHICPKAVALKDIHEDPDRVRRPLLRTGDGWRELPWGEALDLAARRIREIQSAHGRDAVAVYQGNPSVHNYGTLLFGQELVRALKTKNRYSATSVDQLPQMLAAFLMFGHQLLLPIPDIDRTDYLLILGANPLVSNGSLMTAPDVATRLKDIRARGGKIIVLDPRRTETAEKADAHHFIRPGADALFLLAALEVIFAERRERLGRLEGFTEGVAALRAAAARFPPERVAAAVGIPAGEIRAIARAFSEARRAVCYGRIGVSTQEFGGLASWLVYALNIVTGNFDREGGAMFTLPAFDLVALTARRRQAGHFGKYASRVRGLKEFGGELPAAALAEEIETPGDGQIRALITSAGNPVLSTPNGRRLERALSGLEFMVSIDIYRNETTRHAHLILPPTSALEHDHYDVAFHLFAVRNTAKYSPALFAKPAGALHDYEIYLGLAERLAPRRGLKALAGRLISAAIRRLGPKHLVDLELRRGPYGLPKMPLLSPLSLGALTREPHGVDLGPLRPCLPGRLYTADGKIALAPREFLDDLPRLEARLGAAPALALIGRRELRSNNSWMHNAPRLMKGKERCTLLMHPEDAAARGLASGQRVRISSRAGEVYAPLEISDEVMPGVVSLPHGYGHDREGVQLSVASARPGASANDLTDEAVIDALSGNAALSGVPVEVRGA